MAADPTDPAAVLGEQVQFTDEIPVAELNRTFNQQRAVILNLAERIARGEATAGERAEAQARMEGDLAIALRGAKAAYREQFVPSGAPSDVDARFIRNDGSVRMGSERITLPGPDGNTIDHVRAGLLDSRTPVSPEHARLLKAFHRYKVANLLRMRGIETMGSQATRVWCEEVIPAMEGLGGATGNKLREMVADPGLFKRVINGTAGTGGDLISNPTIGVRRPTSMARPVAGLIRRQMVANKTFVPATMAGRGLPRLRAAISNDPVRFTPQAFTTGTASVSLKDFVINALVDSNWFRDVAAVADPMTMIMDWLDQSEIDGIEAMVLHGDTAGTHQDSGIATWTLNSYFASGQLDGTDSPIKQWLGLRARSADDSTTTSGGGSFTSSDLVTPSASLNTWDAGSVLTVGLNGIYTISTTSEFVTADVFGPRAFNAAGVVGAIAGKQVQISEFLPKEFDTSTGMYTGNNLGNLIIQWNPRAWVIYEMDSADADYDVSEPHRGARYIGRNMTAVLSCEAVSGEKPVAVLYNIG